MVTKAVKKTEIYADVLFFINFCMDLICLYVSARICRAPVKALRLAAGAALGGLYAVASCELCGFPAFMSAAGASFIICLTAMGGKDAATVSKRTAAFFAFSALLGGVCFLLLSLCGKETYYNGALYFETGPFFIVLTGAAASSFFLLYLRKERTKITAARAEAVIEIDGKKRNFTALIDSGLLLCDPISADPVILIKKEPLCLLAGDVDPSSLRGFRIIPSDKGLISAFRPGKISIKSESAPLREVSALIGIDCSGGTFSDMEALVPASLL